MSSGPVGRPLSLSQKRRFEGLLGRIMENVNRLAVLSALEEQLRRLIIVNSSCEPPPRVLPSSFGRALTHLNRSRVELDARLIFLLNRGSRPRLPKTVYLHSVSIRGVTQTKEYAASERIDESVAALRAVYKISLGRYVQDLLAGIVDSVSVAKDSPYCYFHARRLEKSLSITIKEKDRIVEFSMPLHEAKRILIPSSDRNPLTMSKIYVETHQKIASYRSDLLNHLS